LKYPFGKEIKNTAYIDLEPGLIEPPLPIVFLPRVNCQRFKIYKRTKGVNRVAVLTEQTVSVYLKLVSMLSISTKKFACGKFEIRE
tara:strand:+ start:138 stop:395 length:258 start_codon:yes stop_codon:yes gene_type:complete